MIEFICIYLFESIIIVVIYNIYLLTLNYLFYDILLNFEIIVFDN